MPELSKVNNLLQIRILEVSVCFSNVTKTKLQGFSMPDRPLHFEEFECDQRPRAPLKRRKLHLHRVSMDSTPPFLFWQTDTNRIPLYKMSGAGPQITSVARLDQTTAECQSKFAYRPTEIWNTTNFYFNIT